MKKVLRILALGLALCMMLASVSALAEATEEPVATPEVEMTLPTGNADDVLITVNGQEVLRSEVDYWNDTLTNYYASYGYDTSDSEMATYLYAYALDYAATYAVMGQLEEQNGLALTEEETAAAQAEGEAAWESLVQQYLDYYGGLTDESTEEEKTVARTNALVALESMGYTESSYVDSYIDDALYNKLYDFLTTGAEVTDEEVQAAFDSAVEQDKETYEGNVAMYEYYTGYYGMESYYIPEGFRGCTQILLEVDEELLTNYTDLAAKLEEQESATTETVTDADAATDEATEEPAETAEATAEPEEVVTQEQVDAAKAAIIASVQDKVDDINTRLAAGEDFLTLVDEYNVDPGMTQEPYRTEGYPVAQDSILYDPEFIKAAFSVNEIGELSEPYVGSYGVYLVRYQCDIPAGPVELTDEIKADLKETALTEKKSTLFNDALNAAKAEANIVYSDEVSSYVELLTAE